MSRLYERSRKICLIKEIVLFDDRMEIYFNSPIKKSPDESAVPIGNIIKYKQELHFQAMRKELRNFYRSSFSILS